MNIPCIVIITDNVVDTIKPSTKENCERDFLDACSVNISNFADYSQEDVNAIIEDGYAMKGNGSICLTWVNDIHE
jgi:hypothetical protein